MTEPVVTTLANGLRLLAIRMPWLATVSLSVFVRTGSLHESKRLNGISHVVEHMAFKGTATRDCQRINLDAERLGAEVNAHTDKDHTAFHMQGQAAHAGVLMQMLADIVRHSSFPAAELERERQVILQEFAEDEDDPLSLAFRLFDSACYGTHPVAQAVIGTRANIERFTREDLLAYVQQQYGAANIVVGVAGDIDPEALQREAEAAFGSMPAGQPNVVAPPQWIGGLRARRHSGSSQSHMVLGFPLPAMAEDDDAGTVAAALLGEGMSSPLMDRLREQRALVYHASCSADVMPQYGQFVIEASTSPQQLDELLTEVATLLHEHAASTDAIGLERARNQIRVRCLRTLERPGRRLEEAAQDLFTFGRVRPLAERLAQIEAVSASQARAVFERMLQQPPSLALVGKVVRGAEQRFAERLAAGTAPMGAA